jgi:hypothetical protein
MGLIRRVLVYLVAFAGQVDGGLILGGGLIAWLTPSSLTGYLPTSLLLVGAAIGAAVAATLSANVLFRTTRGRYLPVLALTVITGVALAAAQTWGLEHWLDESLRRPLLLSSVILIPLVASASAMAFRAPSPGRRLSVPMVGVIVVLVVLALFLVALFYFVGAGLSSFS